LRMDRSEQRINQQGINLLLVEDAASRSWKRQAKSFDPVCPFCYFPYQFLFILWRWEIRHTMEDWCKIFFQIRGSRFALFAKCPIPIRDGVVALKEVPCRDKLLAEDCESARVWLDAVQTGLSPLLTGEFEPVGEHCSVWRHFLETTFEEAFSKYDAKLLCY
jgi:hypothetical protein